MSTGIRSLLDGGLSDARLEILRWAKGGEDLVIGVRQPNSDLTLIVRLVWATRLALSMDFGQYAA